MRASLAMMDADLAAAWILIGDYSLAMQFLHLPVTGV
jgi:hypothetical protein